MIKIKKTLIDRKQKRKLKKVRKLSLTKLADREHKNLLEKIGKNKRTIRAPIIIKFNYQHRQRNL